MTLILPKDITLDSLERLDPYYSSTHISFNGHFYDHSRKIYLTRKGGDYILTPIPGKHNWAKLSKGTSEVSADHHYIVDANYKFINSFITIEGNHICSLEQDHVMTVYISKSCAFFRSLPYTIKSSLMEEGQNVFQDYTKLKKTS